MDDKEYKVTKVSEQMPRVWEGPNGKVYYIKVMLEGHNKPVSIGKKAPDALKVGDTVYGHVLVEQSYPEDKFKAGKKPFGGGGGGGNYQPRDDAAIRAQWAIGQSVALWNGLTAAERGKLVADQVIEAQAAKLFSMVDRIKDSGSHGNTQPTQQGTAATNEPQNPEAAADLDPVYYPVEGEEINLDEIPF